MVQCLRALTDFPKVLSSVPRTHTAADKCLIPSSGGQMYIQTEYVFMHFMCMGTSSVCTSAFIIVQCHTAKWGLEWLWPGLGALHS